MRVQNIGKLLTNAGFKKIRWDSRKGCSVGDYEVKKFGYLGVMAMVNVNTGIFNKKYEGASIEKIMDVLSENGIKVENRKGVIAIFS